MTRLMILDRDGVINRDDVGYINNPSDWHALPGSLEAMVELYQAGFTIVIMTNQSGINRGYLTEDDLSRIHEKMQNQVKALGGEIAKVYYCWHRPDEGCRCRKPKTGMLKDMVRDFPDVDLKEAYVVGDSWNDILAGRAMGCKTLLVQTGNGALALERHGHELENTTVVADLRAASQTILAKEGYSS